MKIALLGTRGIPARYGGFETFAEELCARLAERGHDVTVYCRPNGIDHPGPSYRGVRLIVLPAIRHKYLDTLSHTCLSTLHLLVQRREVALFCNGANAIFTLWPRLLGLPTVLNVDGIERQRRKWNALARGWYWLSEWLTKWFPTAVVADAEVIREYYAETYNKPTHLIAYGAPTGKVATRAILDHHGLEPGAYFLYVSRLEPENNALLVVRAFERTDGRRKLVIVGDAPYAKDYIAAVKATSDPRIIFTGAIYGDGYHELQSHCFAYIHATEVGGTHPALIEAMGRAAPTLYLNTPENIEVAGDAGMPFGPNETALAELIEKTAVMAPAELAEWGARAEARTRSRYDWEQVTDQYEALLSNMIQRPARLS